LYKFLPGEIRVQWFYGLAGWQQAVLATTFTWAFTAAGATLVFFFKKVSEGAFSILMSFAAGIMLASTFFSLLLPSLDLIENYSYIYLTLGFVAGGLLIILCDVITPKLKVFSKSESVRSCAVMCMAVTMHNIPEGLAIGVAFGALSAGGGTGTVAACMLALGIGIQNFPEGMCVAFPLRANGFSTFKSFFIGQLSGVVEIVAGFVGAITVSFSNALLPFALTFSAGAMVAVVCSELIPECFSNGKIRATLGIVVGFAIMMALDLAFS
jgi:ZIP family zinc transporter